MLKTKHSVVSALLALATLIGALSSQAHAEQLQNPAIAVTNEAMVATGTCVAKYIGRFDNGSLEPAAVARHVAARCQREITRSVGFATLMSGRPDDYAKNLEYINAVFTTNAVMRFRANRVGASRS